jgi:uncharacterized membrane protein YfcA
MTLTTLVLAIAVVATTSAVHGAVGFGMNLLAVPFLAALDASLVPGPAVAAGLVLSLLVLTRERAPLDRRLGWAVLGLAPGTALGLILLAALPRDGLSVATGILVLVAVGLSAVSVDLSPTTPALFTAGAASGFLATSAAIGGPPLALVYSRSTGSDLRAQLSAFFVVTAATSLVALAVSDHFGGSEAATSAALLPGVVLGFLCSSPLRRVVDRVAAVLAIVKGLLG